MSRRSSSLPARPTNGRPVRSSSWPGASPTTTTSAVALPSPNTTCVRPSCRRHRTQPAATAPSAVSRSTAPASARGGSWAEAPGPGRPALAVRAVPRPLWARAAPVPPRIAAAWHGAPRADPAPRRVRSHRGRPRRCRARPAGGNSGRAVRGPRVTAAASAGPPRGRAGFRRPRPCAAAAAPPRGPTRPAARHGSCPRRSPSPARPRSSER
jgi:hypothetical protein